MIVSLLYQLTRGLLSVPTVLLHHDTSKDAELLVLRHENAVLRRQITGQDWTTQQARNLTTDIGEGLDPLRFLLRDRDTKYSAAFDAVFQAEDMNILTSAPQRPKMNAHCERVIRTLRNEVCDHVLILNEAHARQVLAEYQRHYNQHRPHQARQQRPPEPHQQHEPTHGVNVRSLLHTSVLNGLINEYRYAA